MAKENDGYEMVRCENEKCNKLIKKCEAYSFGEYDKAHRLHYFCSPQCAFAKLFGLIQPMQKLMFGTKNAR